MIIQWHGSFSGHRIPLAYALAVLVLIPRNKKEQGKFCGITLLAVMYYKLWGMIIYMRASAVIKFHPGIHVFCHHHGTDTAILETTLEMQMADMQSVPYFQIFLDLAKAFDSIDRDRMSDLLAGYGFAPNMI
jgi:hypothetical protein